MVTLATWAQVPTIISFNPASGPIGTSVLITGTNFSSTGANNTVYFGATKATVTAASLTQLTVTVPAGATYQPVTVTVGGLTAYSLKPFATTFSGGGTIDASSFGTKVDLAVPQNPGALAIGDLDGDGKPDLAVTNTSGSLSVFKNTSTSGVIAANSFAANVDFSTGTGTNPYSVAIGDLDGDGKPDLAIANSGSNSVSVFKNTSTTGTITASSFAAKVDFTTGTYPYYVAIGDLDGDGKPDLAVANGTNATVSIFKNTSITGTITASSFAAKVDFTTGTNPYSVAIGDLDGDGKPDLAVPNYFSNSVSVFRNTSTTGTISASSFAAKVDFSTGTNPTNVAIGDLDGDGKPDLAVLNAISNNVSVFKNTGTTGSITASSFAAKVDFSTGASPIIIDIGDLDGDGKPDLAVANYVDGTFSVFKNTSTLGTITASSFAAKADFSVGTNPRSVAIGDLDGDGKPDLAGANNGSASISIWRNKIVTAASTPTITSFTPISGAVGTSVTITGTNFSTIAANNIVYFGATKATVTATTTTQLTVTVPAGVTYQPITVTVGGLTAYSSKPFVTTFSGGGSIDANSFTAKVDFITGTSLTYPYDVAIGDLDGDGKSDLAVANNGVNSVLVFKNTSTSGAITASSFAAKVEFATGTAPLSVAIGDLDGDGKQDLVVANSTNATVSIFKNTSTTSAITTSSFAVKVDFTTGTNPYSVAIGDLDGDGKPDLAVTNQGVVSVFKNTSTTGAITTSSFAAKVDFTTGASPLGVAIGDLDGDGKPDLAVANNGSTSVSVFKNTSTTGEIGRAHV